MIKRSHIRHFLAVVDAGSFTQAALRLRVTQPTLSTGIAALETLTRSRLFVRDRKHVRLTEAGGRFLPIARDLERQFRLADGFGIEPAPGWPVMKFGTIRTLPLDLLEAAATRLAGRFSVELSEGSDSELRAGLSQGRLHVALGLLRSDDSEDGFIPWFEEPYVMLVPAAHHLANRDYVRPEELAAETMIARRSCEMLDETSRFFTRHRVRPRFSLRSESDERCIRMVAAGLGITTAPLSLRAPGTAALRVEGYDLYRRIGFRFDPAWVMPEATSELRLLADAVRPAGWP